MSRRISFSSWWISFLRYLLNISVLAFKMTHYRLVRRGVLVAVEKGRSAAPRGGWARSTMENPDLTGSRREWIMGRGGTWTVL